MWISFRKLSSAKIDYTIRTINLALQSFDKKKNWNSSLDAVGLLSQILLVWKYTSIEVQRLDRFRVFSKFCVRGRTSPFFGKALAPYELRDQLYLRTLLDFIYLQFNPFSISHQNFIETVSEKLDILTFLIHQTTSHRKRIEFCRQNMWSNHLYLKHTHNVFIKSIP